VVRKEGVLAHTLQKIDVTGALRGMFFRYGVSVTPPPPPSPLLSYQVKF
jgi:hypothetical protein